MRFFDCSAATPLRMRPGATVSSRRMTLSFVRVLPRIETDRT